MARPTRDKEITALLLSPLRNITFFASIAVPHKSPTQRGYAGAPTGRTGI